jgi:hypothetical protein
LNKDIYPTISAIIKELDKNEVESIRRTIDYFVFKYPDIISQFPNEFEIFKNNAKKWSSFVREIVIWNDLSIEEMNRRLLRLCLRYLTKDQEFFKIEDEVGTYTLPTRIDKLNKLSLIAKELIFDIFPSIENHLNFSSNLELHNLSDIRGTIDWNSTILTAVSRGEKTPMQFVCHQNEIKFNTHENILAVACLLRLQKDIEVLFYHKGDDQLNYKERHMLGNLKNHVDNLVSKTILRELIPPLRNYSLKLDRYTIRNLEGKTKQRVRQGFVKQKSYQELLDWLAKYRGYNIRSLEENYANFPIDHEKSIDKMYELWIIFEILNYLVEEKQVKLLKTLHRGVDRFAGFQLQLDNIVFNLIYQYKTRGWSQEESEPDFVIQIEGKEDIPIIMDPKNWSAEQVGDAYHKMLGYLLNLSKYHAEIGILFFPHAKSRHRGDGKEPLSYVESVEEIHGQKITFTTMLVNPKEPKHLLINLEKVYEYIRNSLVRHTA